MSTACYLPFKKNKLTSHEKYTHLLLRFSPRMVTRKNIKFPATTWLVCRNRRVHTPGVGIQAENEITEWKYSGREETTVESLRQNHVAHRRIASAHFCIIWNLLACFIGCFENIIIHQVLININFISSSFQHVPVAVV